MDKSDEFIALAQTRTAPFTNRVKVLQWQPITTAPKDRFVLLCGPSGYTTTPFVYAAGIMHSDYKAGRWIDHANDNLSDWGMVPTHWMELHAPLPGR